MDAFVAQVRERSDILGVVASYVPLKRKGGRYWGCCPFHSEKTPSFSVVPDEGFFYCFGCHAGGNVFKFISMIENVSYFDAIRMQAEKLGIEMPEREKSEKELARERKLDDLRKLAEMAQRFFHNCLVQTRYGEAGLRYFAGRGVGEAVIEEFGLGFAPDAPGKLHDAFLKRGVSEKLLLECGLVVERQGGVYDKFRNRVMIPIADDRGRVVGFGGRVLGDGVPKYLNSPETPLFNKRRLLFGLNRAKKAIRETGRAILVEGYMDAISLAAAGVPNAVASLGTAFTAEQCRLLLRYAKEICNDIRTLEGKNRALRAFLPTLKASGPVERNEYIGKLQSNLGIDEGIIRQELSAYQGDDPAEEIRPRTQRPVTRKADGAVQRAGRVLIRMAWRDPGVAASVMADLEEAPFPYPPHEALLRYIARCAGEHRSPSDEEVLEDLGEEMAAELSRILTEEIDAQDEDYDKYLQVILLAQLRFAFEEHRLRADEMERKGNSDFLQELQKSQRIKKRIDKLNQDLTTNG